MKAKRSAYRSQQTVCAQADALEAALRARGIDPFDPCAWPIWDRWQLDGLAGALEYLQREGCFAMPHQQNAAHP